VRRKELYEIYCISCHGGTGNGKVNGRREKFLGVPSYKDRVITREVFTLL
jgi:cytochrome c